MNGSCSTVLGVLSAHPSDDTVLAIAGHSGLTAIEVEATLGDLKRQHLVRRWETHWQITGTGADAVAAGPAA
jgi:hypothetical protein